MSQNSEKSQSRARMMHLNAVKFFANHLHKTANALESLGGVIDCHDATEYHLSDAGMYLQYLYLDAVSEHEIADRIFKGKPWDCRGESRSFVDTHANYWISYRKGESAPVIGLFPAHLRISNIISILLEKHDKCAKSLAHADECKLIFNLHNIQIEKLIALQQECTLAVVRYACAILSVYNEYEMQQFANDYGRDIIFPLVRFVDMEHHTTALSELTPYEFSIFEKKLYASYKNSVKIYGKSNPGVHLIKFLLRKREDSSRLSKILAALSLKC